MAFRFYYFAHLLRKVTGLMLVPRSRCGATLCPREGPSWAHEETFGKSRSSRDQDQFLAVGRRRPAEIAELSLDCKATESEQMM
jgi:hypothetical protein